MKFKTMRNLSRILLIISLVLFVISCFLFRESEAIRIVLICSTTSIITITTNSLTNEKWACKKCGKMYGVKGWFVNKCPHCNEDLD